MGACPRIPAEYFITGFSTVQVNLEKLWKTRGKSQEKRNTCVSSERNTPYALQVRRRKNEARGVFLKNCWNTRSVSEEKLTNLRFIAEYLKCVAEKTGKLQVYRGILEVRCRKTRKTSGLSRNTSSGLQKKPENFRFIAQYLKWVAEKTRKLQVYRAILEVGCRKTGKLQVRARFFRHTYSGSVTVNPEQQHNFQSTIMYCVSALIGCENTAERCHKRSPTPANHDPC